MKWILLALVAWAIVILPLAILMGQMFERGQR